MRKFTTGELATMQATQYGSLQDTCIIQSYAMTLDAYGAEVATYTDGSAIDCGLNMTPARERRTAEMNVERIDATIRLPLATSIKTTDRVKVTYRFGVILSTALVFEVVGSIRRGPSGLQVDLLAVNP
jgi:head-tail adaptor